MAKIPFSFGGGGGDSSDDCTATAADVLESKTAIYNGSEDDAANGSMKDYSGTSTSASVTNNSSSSRVELTIPNTGKYDTAAKLYTPYSTLASAVSLTAAKIATGNTVMGVTGTYTGVGTAAAAQVLSGYTFSNASSSGISGTMTDKSGTTTSATASLDSSNSRVRMAIPANGYYNTSAYLYSSYSNMRTLIGYTDASKVLSGTTILGLAGTMTDKSGTTTSATSSLDTSNSRLRLQIPTNGYYNTSAYLYASYSNIRSLIGLSASILKYGETVLGVTGTWNGYVATGSDLYYGGATGICGSISTVYTPTALTVTYDSSCIVIQTTTGSTGYGILTFASSLNTSAYSKVTLTFRMVSAPSSSTPFIELSLWQSKPTGSGGSPYLYARKTLSECTNGSSYTVSVDLSGVSQSLYVGLRPYVYSASSGTYSLEVTRIQVSS